MPPVPQLWHPDVPGPLWNGTRRVPRRQIEAYCRVVAREFKPEKIILFGSYADGRATKDSDVDLVVVMPHRGRDVDKMCEIRARVRAPFPMDLLVWKPGKYSPMQGFNEQVLTHGEVMYACRSQSDAVRVQPSRLGVRGRSPSPQPSPAGRGSHAGRVSDNRTVRAGQTASKHLPLPPRERAGVRVKACEVSAVANSPQTSAQPAIKWRPARLALGLSTK